jgi:two-component system response regulator YesN
MQFLTQCRMEKAQDLLANTDWPIEQVATFVGLKPGRFRELFRETTGLSPTEFRVQRMAEKQS